MVYVFYYFGMLQDLYLLGFELKISLKKVLYFFIRDQLESGNFLAHY